MNNRSPKRLKINIILPYFVENASGGIKVIYEYAKRLSNRGHDVVVYHSTKTSYTMLDDLSRRAMFFRYIRRVIKGKYKINQRPTWFNLPNLVVCRKIPYITNFFIRDADICLSTWWATAFDIYELSASKGIKFNLIQGYEASMTKYSDLVFDSYKLPIYHIAISKHLYDVVYPYSPIKVEYIPNAIDLSIYYEQKPIEERVPETIIMLYSYLVSLKGSKYGLEALIELKDKYPKLEVCLFSSEKKTKDIPDWINYVYGCSDLTPLYNNAAIFISPSLEEGWSLPPMEAMACGCACVCTNIPPHLSYMKDNVTCLFVGPKNVNQIVEKVSFLIENRDMRIKLAKGGKDSTLPYDWENSVDKIEGLFIQMNSLK